MSSVVDEALLTAPQYRQFQIIKKRQALELRNFWVHAFKGRGLSNVTIAKKLNISESTVRSILKKGAE